MPPRDAFPGYDEPLNVDMEPDEALKLLMEPEAADDADQIEPELDE